MTAPQPEQEPAAGEIATILAALIIALTTSMAVLGIVRLLARIPGVYLDALMFMAGMAGPVDRDPRSALRAIFEIPDEMPGNPATGSWAEIQYQQYNQNVRRRASYLINAARRISRAWIAEGAPTSLTPAMDDALDREVRFARQHFEATYKREQAAAQVAEMAQQWGSIRLGWHAVMDRRTSAECRAANGRNFDPNRIPPIGLPGSVHPHCRCRAGRPFATRARVETLRPDHGAGAA